MIQEGFHILDTNTLEHTPIDNPYKLFYNVYYDDTNHKLIQYYSIYKDKIVKIIVRKKSKIQKSLKNLLINYILQVFKN